MTALERAAKAIREEAVRQSEEGMGYVGDVVDGILLDGVFDLRLFARAVLMAVRELDAETKLSASIAYCDGRMSVWEAHIDAILETEKSPAPVKGRG